MKDRVLDLGVRAVAVEGVASEGFLDAQEELSRLYMYCGLEEVLGLTRENSRIRGTTSDGEFFEGSIFYYTAINSSYTFYIRDLVISIDCYGGSTAGMRPVGMFLEYKIEDLASFVGIRGLGVSVLGRDLRATTPELPKFSDSSLRLAEGGNSTLYIRSLSEIYKGKEGAEALERNDGWIVGIRSDQEFISVFDYRVALQALRLGCKIFSSHRKPEVESAWLEFLPDPSGGEIESDPGPTTLARWFALEGPGKKLNSYIQENSVIAWHEDVPLNWPQEGLTHNLGRWVETLFRLPYVMQIINDQVDGSSVPLLVQVVSLATTWEHLAWEVEENPKVTDIVKSILDLYSENAGIPGADKGMRDRLIDIAWSTADRAKHRSLRNQGRKYLTEDDPRGLSILIDFMTSTSLLIACHVSGIGKDSLSLMYSCEVGVGLDGSEDWVPARVGQRYWLCRRIADDSC